MNNYSWKFVAIVLLASCISASCQYEADSGGNRGGDGGGNSGGNSGGNPGGLVSGNPDGPLRIYRNPYSAVSWQADLRLLAQHHDHNGASTARLRAYDLAGYNVVALMDYSGAPSHQTALRRRLWPAEEYISESTLAEFQNIRLLIPSAEEVGIPQRHYTSPFLTNYIQYGEESESEDRVPQYSNEAELSSLIWNLGGLPVKAHPWYSASELLAGPDVFGMEIYSAYIAAKEAQGVPEFVNEARNQKLLFNWDTILASGRWWVGVAVNDHFGPYSSSTSTDPTIRDSGKILVFARDATLAGYRDAFGRGAFFAIRDNGVEKGEYPVIESISVDRESITIDASGASDVKWISSGREVGNGPTLSFSAIPPRSVYLRAEVHGTAHVVFTQPFVLRHVDDIDGDGWLTKTDESYCAEMVVGRTPSTPEIVAACDGR